jgi:adenylate cyclase
MSSHRGESAKNCCVLIADGDPNHRRDMVKILCNDGYQILEADSCESALDLALQHPVDSFLLDIHIPGAGGFEVCRKLRQMELYKFKPVLLFTNSGSHDHTVAAFESGCDDVILSDPEHADNLRLRLHELIERKEYLEHLERSRRTMTSYVSRRIVEVISTASHTGVLPPPEEREIAVLFTDLRGFTSLSEEVEPVVLFELVSKLLGHQVQLVHEFGGYVDKFGGDGVMAIFEGPEMAVQSCRCALEIINSSHLVVPEDSRQLWRSGIGIHMGRAVIGNIGSADRLDYTAIGTTVNLAARLCGQAKATSIVVSKSVRDAVSRDSSLQFHFERQVEIRGMREPVTVFTLGD